MALDHSAYEGVAIQGKVDTVMSRGRVIVENNTYSGNAGHGQYLRRGLSSYLV
jgi:dihydropyrimidinase